MGAQLQFNFKIKIKFLAKIYEEFEVANSNSKISSNLKRNKIFYRIKTYPNLRKTNEIHEIKILINENRKKNQSNTRNFKKCRKILEI